MSLTKSGAKKILIVFTAVNAVAVLAAAGIFSGAIRSDISFMRDTVMNYASQTALERGKSVSAVFDGKKTSLAEARSSLAEIAKKDPRILYILVFSKTADENFFRVSAKIDAGKHISIPIENGQRVREESEENWLRRGLSEPCVNRTLFSDKSSFWHNAYAPLALKDTTYVARLMIASSDAVIALEDHSKRISRLEAIIIIGTVIFITITLIAAFIFLRNFTLFISGITGYVKKAASGETELSLNENADEDISELALSFNSLVGELRDKEKLITDLKKREKAAVASALAEKDSGVKDELSKEIEELRRKLDEAVADKKRIEEDSAQQDELSEIFRKGVAILKENRLAEAETVFSALTLVKPDGFGAYFNLGVVYAKMRNLDRSLEMFEKARAINPGHPHTESYIGKVMKLKSVMNAR
jgi:tetratricopeptide (TPR) repeat protein